jgi:hypothetical protein
MPRLINLHSALILVRSCVPETVGENKELQIKYDIDIIAKGFA